MSFLEQNRRCIDPETNGTQRRFIVLEEKRRQYRLENKTSWSITKVKVEKCITKDENEKGCEAILIATKEGQKSRGYYVELKGMSVRDAFKQMQSSLDKTKRHLEGFQLFGRIVPSEYKRTHFLQTIEISLSKQFKALGGNLIIREKNSDTI